MSKENPFKNGKLITLYVEGKDQFRGWFNSSLITWTILNDQSNDQFRGVPYNQILSHGFILDKDGKKMSKSLNNVIEPEQIINKFGVDLLRLWISSCDLTKDLKFSFSILENLRESYQKIRNSFRFLLGNLANLPPDLKNEKNLEKKLSIIDYYILNQLEDLKKKAKKNYQRYEFNLIYSDLLRFCTNDLSSFYFEINKDTLYCDKVDSFRRKKIVTTFYFLFQGMLEIVSPILPFLAEEVYQNIPFNFGYAGKKSVFLIEDSPSLVSEEEKKELVLITDFFLPFRKEVYFFLEKARQEKIIESNSQSDLIVYFKEKIDYFDYSKLSLNELLLVAEVKIIKTLENDMQEGELCFLKVKKTDLARCLRCWNYRNCRKNLCLRCEKFIPLKNFKI